MPALLMLLPALLFLAKDAAKVAKAVTHYGEEIAEREGVTPEEGRAKAIEAAGGAKELTRIYITERRQEQAAAEQEQAWQALSTIHGRDPAAGVTADPGPVGQTPLVTYAAARGFGGTWNPPAETPDVFLPALVVAGLWFWSKQR